MSGPAQAHAHAALAHHFESLEKQAQAQRLGMWLFLATEVLLFAALFAAYGVYRWLYSGRLRRRPRAASTTWLGGVNTFVLVTSLAHRGPRPRRGGARQRPAERRRSSSSRWPWGWSSWG